MSKYILIKNLRLAGIMWYFCGPYWMRIYSTFSEINKLSTRVAYGSYRIDSNYVLNNTDLDLYLAVDVI